MDRISNWPDIQLILDGMDIERGWISGLSIILKSQHILKTRSESYLISKTRSRSNNTTRLAPLSFIMTIKIFNPPTSYKVLLQLVHFFGEESDLKIQRLRDQTPLISKNIISILIVIIDLFIWKIVNSFCSSLANGIIAFIYQCCILFQDQSTPGNISTLLTTVHPT